MECHNFVGKSSNTKRLPDIPQTLGNYLNLISLCKHRPPYPSLHRLPIKIKLEQISLFGGVHCHTT